ncbi:MAG: sulfotransferase [Phycisphaeraceae bacterium]
MHQPPLPHFLIIGAMKSGTTTLYRDLLTHPRVFMPVEKEPNNLASDEVLTDAGTAAYRELFRDARPEQCCGEASTAYTKIPWIEGVPQRAMRLLGPALKLIYIVREPVSRAVSHYHHQFARGAEPRNMDFAFRRNSELIDFSCYAMQLEPWLATFGRDSVKVVCFEQYIADRAAGAADVLAFLGLDPAQHQVAADRVYHATRAYPVLTDPWKCVTHHWLYQRYVRPRLSRGV